MSRETLQESLSAVMDNEADEMELRRVLASAGSDEAMAMTCGVASRRVPPPPRPSAASATPAASIRP